MEEKTRNPRALSGSQNSTQQSTNRVGHSNEVVVADDDDDIEASSLLGPAPPPPLPRPHAKRASTNAVGNTCTRCLLAGALLVFAGMLIFLSNLTFFMSAFEAEPMNWTCVRHAKSNLFKRACWRLPKARAQQSISSQTSLSLPELLQLELNSNIYGRTILVSASHNKGATSSDGNQTSLYNMPASSASDLNLFALHASPDGVDLSKSNSWGTRSVDSEMMQTIKKSTWDGWLTTFPFAADRSKKAAWIDASSWVYDLFYVVPLTKTQPSTLQLPRILIESISLYPDNCVIHLKISQRVDASTTTVSFSLTVNVVLLSDAPALARQADPRIGYFASSFSVVGEFPKDASHRQSASLIEIIHARKKFVYYVDPSVPKKYRGAVRAGVEAWDVALVAAGYPRGTMRAVLPEDQHAWPSDYDAGDSRYSSISWSVSFDHTFAFGPSLVDPRSGEILDSDIVFSHGWLAAWSNSRKDYFDESEAARHYSSSCRKSKVTLESLSDWRLLIGDEAALLEADDMLLQGVTDVIMHEVGHTLGLRHNFKGSIQGLRFEDLKNNALAAKGFSASVMDYNGLNIESSSFPFQTVVGAYDVRAIEYGYSKLQANQVRAVQFDGGNLTLELASSPGLALIAESAGPFATDEDDARTGNDPDVAVFDLSSEPLKFHFAVLERIASKQAGIEVESWQRRAELLQAVHRRVNAVAKAVARFLGGETVDRRGRGSVQAVPSETQAQALNVLLELVVYGTYQSSLLLRVEHDPTNKELPWLDQTGFTCPSSVGVSDEDDRPGPPPFRPESFCLGVRAVDVVMQGEEVRRNVLLALLDMKRLERIASTQSSERLRAYLERVSDALWFQDRGPLRSENLASLWVARMTALPCAGYGSVREAGRVELSRVSHLARARRNDTAIREHHVEMLAGAKLC